MEHFKNINSLRELKQQYKQLAIANHPDRGGDTATMQEINAEFDVLFAIWAHAPETTQEERSEGSTGTQYRRHFYTANGWEGSRYDARLSTTEITARIRAYIKLRYKGLKFSIRTKYYSGGSSISLKLVSGPVQMMRDDAPRAYISTVGGCIARGYEDFLTPEGLAIVKDIDAFAMSYNYDDSDGMIDYFDTNFYFDFHVGSWNAPFKQTAVQPAPASRRVTAEEQREAVAIEAPKAEAAEAVRYVDYSEKAFAIVGDTRPLVAKLKELGGKFNARLSCGAGWIFSKRNASTVCAALGLAV